MFKRLARSPVIPWIGGTVIWMYMSLLAHTLRWRFEGMDHLRKVWTGPKGWVAATWHSRILLMPVAQILFRPKWPKSPHPPALMVSNSRDGEFTKRAGTLLGLFIIRGSAANKGKSKDKRGFMGAKEAMQVMNKGGGIVVTIDGPKGPPEVVGIGAVKLAQQMGAPIIVYGLSANCRRLNSWDRLLFPGLFARAACVLDIVPTAKDMDSEALRLDVELALKRVTARADELAGLQPLASTSNASKAPVQADEEESEDLSSDRSLERRIS
ncbi:MAG: DUF374 domain-containing protein [Alphaproteobacteria bacterium]|nr:DUF374 domain-containing protein [Alphaproteobacteria bacterium]